MLNSLKATEIEEPAAIQEDATALQCVTHLSFYGVSARLAHLNTSKLLALQMSSQRIQFSFFHIFLGEVTLSES